MWKKLTLGMVQPLLAFCVREMDERVGSVCKDKISSIIVRRAFTGTEAGHRYPKSTAFC